MLSEAKHLAAVVREAGYLCLVLLMVSTLARGQNSVEKNLTSSIRVYPAMGNGKVEFSPAVKILTPDSSFGGEVRLAWSKDGFILDFIVLDRTASPPAEGRYLWQGDSVQVAIDTRPEESKAQYTSSCFELGFALQGASQVCHYAWQTGENVSFNWSGVKEKGARTKGGYHLNILIPWRNLQVDPAHLPDRLGVDVLFNHADGGRKFVEWTPGLGTSKQPWQYVQVVRVTPENKSAACLTIVDPREYQKNEKIIARYSEYALADLDAENATLTGIGGNANLETSLKQTQLPKIATGQTRIVDFHFSSAVLEGQETYTLKVKAGTEVKAQTQLRGMRKSLNPQIRTKLKNVQDEIAAIKILLASKPNMAKDSYVDLGLTLATRFVDRISDPNQQPDWGLLQAREISWVLKETRRRINGHVQPTRVVRPASEPITMRDGIFYIGPDRPYYFGGYGHFSMVDQDIPVFNKFGATLIQQERGPLNLNPDFSITDNGRGILQTLKKAEANRIKIDLLLSPHCFPAWAPTQDPDDKPVENPGFVKYNIDHPTARKVVQKWLETIIPRVKDSPALFSLNLSNEPSYCNSGRDKYSRPLWIKYLRNRHRTIENLNGLYGTNYKFFEAVPVPKITMPAGVAERRAYYDWCIFNQQHFADWHAWMQQIIKRAAPNVRTSSKITPNIFYPENMNIGVDPELFCRVTDLAGNDCTAFLTAEGPYAYEWTIEELWYDLLHSFRGRPVFNSENHLIPDGTSAIRLPPEHIYSVLWQGALHHCGATTIWVWEEPGKDPALQGSIYLRPASIYTAGKAMLDLARLAPAMAAINQDRPHVAILYSVPSIFWQPDYSPTVKNLYTELVFMGQTVTFVSERQLIEGQVPKVEYILLPHVTHVTQGVVDGLKIFTQKGGKLVFAGKENLVYDEYHRPRNLPPELLGSAVIDLKDRSLRDVVKPFVTELINLTTKKPAAGIEYRVVRDRASVLIPMINFYTRSQRLKLVGEGKAVDLISNEPVNLNSFVLEPMTPKLLKISK